MGLLTKIKNELNQLGIQPKKSLGQNFLINEGIYKKIVAAVESERGDTILEIGPGLGTLTEYLAKTGADIIGIEKDHKLADYLKTKFTPLENAPRQAAGRISPIRARGLMPRASSLTGFTSPKNVKLQAESRAKRERDGFELSDFGARVKIIEGDILKFQPKTCKLKPVTYKVVGNIPYYITSHLLKVIFDSPAGEWPKPKTIVLLVQKEVAQRIKAKPPEMSLLAVSVQYYAESEIVSYVSRGSFYPSPDVDSAIIKLTPHFLSDSVSFQKNFFEIVKAGFAGKRKQLINNLFPKIKLSKDEIQKKLISADIAPQRRAETLTIEEWRKITNIFQRRNLTSSPI